MKRRGTSGSASESASLDELIEQVTVDANGHDEGLWAFRQAFKDEVTWPTDAFVIGEPVSVVEIDYDGYDRRGLTARCRREDGAEHVVAAADVVFPDGSTPARYMAAYRHWLGLAPHAKTTPVRRERRHKARADDLDLRRPVHLVVLSVKERAARCRVPETNRVLTLRAASHWDLVPGEIVTVQPRKQWSHAGHPYLSGEIQSCRLDVPALGLAPLRLEESDLWDPKEEYWGEEGEPIEEWAKPIIARGPRRAFEMEQVLPGWDPDDFDEDPITLSNDLKDNGEHREASKILMDLCDADLRCLDAHAHLGNAAFDHSPKEAIRHYAVGMRIGELSLGDGFDGVLPWGLIDNRPFLRCMHGYGLCLWRLRRTKDARDVFERMLWLNPSDNQGARFLVADVDTGKIWEEQKER